MSFVTMGLSGLSLRFGSLLNHVSAGGNSISLPLLSSRKTVGTECPVYTVCIGLLLGADGGIFRCLFLICVGN